VGKILVTGADGFIGSHLVEALLADGKDVRAMVFYNSFNSWGWLDESKSRGDSRLEVVAGDVRDSGFVRDSVRGCDVVYHLAALIAIPYSYRAPQSYVETNVIGTLNVVQACRDLGVSKLVQTSTSEVYGSAQQVPIPETHPLVGQSPYAASKIAADQIAMSFYYSYETPVTIIRPFNTFGPRQSARAFIPAVIIQALTNKVGNRSQIKLGSLQPTRDLNYVEDSVSGFIKVGETPDSIGKVLNIGSGREISMGDCAKLIGEVMGLDLEITSDQSRFRPDASEVQRLCADTTQARNLLGWKPVYGGADGFKLALQKTCDWFRDPANLDRYKGDIYNV
jgi:NAD dependent epimerase/dehydratase